MRIRKTGPIEDSTDFDLPADRMRWSYNATNRSLLQIMEKYESYADDGKLKFFCFGVHASDFERDGNWCDLEEFAAKYGNRPGDYYYAAVSDILEYEDAVKALDITETHIVNDSEKDIYATVNGEKVVIFKHSKIEI